MLPGGMAPKVEARTKAPKVLTNCPTNALLSSISLGPDSGWRSTQPKRVADLKRIFREGGFSNTALSNVSLLRKTDASDQYIIDDGLASVTALKELEAEYGSDAGEFHSVPWPANLVEIFNEGFPVTWLQYEDDSMATRRLWNLSKHDEVNNKFRKSSVKSAIETATEYKNLFGDGAKAEMLAVLGGRAGIVREAVDAGSRRLASFSGRAGAPR